MDADPVLRCRVLSPDQVAGRLKYDRACGQAGGRGVARGDYTWIYALPTGELSRFGAGLRSGREQRKSRGRAKATGARILGMRSIEDRPGEVADRHVPGRYEGDLIVGKNGASAAGTLVERKSRFTARPAAPVRPHRRPGADQVTDLPTQLVKSITWDQGAGMADDAALSLATKIDVYFAHPHSPWERGTNENTNGLIREYIPKGTLVPSDPGFLNSVSHSLNIRPRRILDYRT